MTMQNTVTSADADWSGMSEDETVTNCNALKTERSRTFLEIVVSYPVFCAYPEYEGKPYYAIKYEEKGEIIIGFGTYKPKVLSQYLRQYFLPSAEPERKMGEWTLYESRSDIYDLEGVCTWGRAYRCSECGFIHWVIEDFGIYSFCPECGARLEWK